MYRTAGRGAVSPKAIQFCQQRGIQVVPGQCPLMFLPDAEPGIAFTDSFEDRGGGIRVVAKLRTQTQPSFLFSFSLVL